MAAMIVGIVVQQALACSGSDHWRSEGEIQGGEIEKMKTRYGKFSRNVLG